MKILIVFPHFMAPGGAAHTVLAFANALQSRGHIVEIFCANASPDILVDNKELKITLLNIPISSTYYYWLLFPYWQVKINTALKKYDSYIFFPQVFPSNWWIWIYKLFNKSQNSVWYCHEPSAFIHSKTWINAIPNIPMRLAVKCLNPILKKLDLWLELQNNLVICNSSFTSDYYKSTYLREPFTFIYPPCIHDSIQTETLKEEFIFTVCRLTKFKNVDNLINAYSKIKDLFEANKLIIAGDGEEKDSLIQLSKKIGLQDKVIFLGKVDEKTLTQLYSKAKVTVITSVFEPFGLVPIESMNFGTPVIAHDSGGPKETIIHGKTGFLYNTFDDLVACIQSILCMDENKYREMQKNCKDHAHNFGITSSVNKLEAAFRTL